ncbi:MAG: hypothetical protein Q9214_002465 [Letrouitia sp. 1 TL-2023]
MPVGSCWTLYQDLLKEHSKHEEGEEGYVHRSSDGKREDVNGVLQVELSCTKGQEKEKGFVQVSFSLRFGLVSVFLSVYQEYTAKSVTDKFANLNSQMDRVIHDANAEIDTLNEKILALQVDKEKLQSDNTSLVAAFRDKSRKHQQTQELYDQLKRKEMTAATQSAALESVDEALGNVPSRHGVHQKSQAQPHHFMSHAQGQQDFVQLPLDHNGHEKVHSHQRSGGAGDSGNDGLIPAFVRRATPHGSRSTGPGNKNIPPAQHRTQLGPSPQGIGQWYQQNQRGRMGMMNVSTQNQTPFQRNSHSNLNANINRDVMNGGGTGLRVKFGRQQVCVVERRSERYPQLIACLTVIRGSPEKINTSTTLYCSHTLRHQQSICVQQVTSYKHARGNMQKEQLDKDQKTLQQQTSKRSMSSIQRMMPSHLVHICVDWGCGIHVPPCPRACRPHPLRPRLHHSGPATLPILLPVHGEQVVLSLRAGREEFVYVRGGAFVAFPRACRRVARGSSAPTVVLTQRIPPAVPPAAPPAVPNTMLVVHVIPEAPAPLCEHIPACHAHVPRPQAMSAATASVPVVVVVVVVVDAVAHLQGCVTARRRHAYGVEQRLLASCAQQAVEARALGAHRGVELEV